MNKLACILALSSAFVSFNAHAWGNDGHRTVGAIADQLIKGSAAEKQVQALLLPGESLSSIATWADCVKGTYCGPQSDEMVSYTTANPKHAEYHYTDVPYQLAHYEDHGVGTADHDIVQTLKQCIAVLQGQGNATTNPHNFTPRQALLMLTHLTGDIAQPLHVGEGYVGKNGGFVVPTQKQLDDKEAFATQGGNNLLLDDIRLTASSTRLMPPDDKPAPATPQATRAFHSYWDTTVVNYAFRRLGVRTPEQFAQKVIADNPVVSPNSGDAVTWPYQWADQTLVVAKLAYADTLPGAMAQQTSKTTGELYNVWPLSIPDNYPVPSSAAAKAQLIQGGYHLAAVLRAIWP